MDLLSTHKLDNMVNVFGLIRSPGETDDQLRFRMKSILLNPRPHPSIQRLVYLMAKLGLAKTAARNILPVGLAW